VLRNNPTASGFRYADVQAAGEDFETFTHYWGNRCVVEIFSPSLSQGEEERVFYEVSEAYPVEINGDGLTVHSSTDITLTNGDVWWRRMAVNMPDVRDDGSGYVNLVGGDTGDGFTAPSFRAYHLEAPTFSDLVRNADVYSYGKVKAILPNSREVRRRSSVTFGEGNNYASKLVRYTSFNPSLFPFKDLPNRYGAVNYLEAFNEFLLIIQEDKLSRLPVSRQILSDAAGGQQLIASDIILGTQAFYAGDYGCDGNPESVVVVDNDIYFANKSVAEVYRFNRNEGGVRVISDNGMEEFFERLFRDAGVDARIVGGYDPLHDEFLISIFRPDELQAATPLYVSQPTLGIAPVEDDPGEPEPDVDEPVGLQPYSFTFDFTSAPDPLNAGGEGDDWLYLQYDGTGYFNVVDGVPPIIPPAYNQTVGGRDGVAKWTMLDGSSLSMIRFFSTSPENFAGTPYQNQYGRINSWPDPTQYSTYRLRAEIYYSGINNSDVDWNFVRFGLGTGGFNYTIPTPEYHSLPLTKQENQWITYDTGEQSVSSFQGNSMELLTIQFIGEDGSEFQDGGFIALNNVTLSFTP